MTYWNSIKSKAKKIEKNTFSYTQIEEIFIPSTVIQICENAFYDSRKLQRIEIPINSKLQTIETNAFEYLLHINISGAIYPIVPEAF